MTVVPDWRGGASCCVVMASDGYPGAYETGFPITGVPEAERNRLPGLLRRCDRCPAGRTGQKGLKRANRIFDFRRAGSRGNGTGTDIEEARKAAYRGVALIDFNGGWYRRDIGG